MTDVFRWRLLPGFAAGAVLLLMVLLVYFGEPAEWVEFFVDRQVRPWLFIVLMLLLPLAGFPLTVFLLAAGIKFGVLEGLAITAGVIGVHLVITYLLTHSLLRPYIWKLLARTRYDLPEISARHRLVFSLVFMAVPVLPYAVKNFSLALLNIPLHIYLPVAWGVNLLLAIPFIGIGYSVIANPALVWVFIVLLGGSYFLVAKLWQKYGGKKDSPALGRDDEQGPCDH